MLLHRQPRWPSTVGESRSRLVDDDSVFSNKLHRRRECRPCTARRSGRKFNLQPVPLMLRI